MKVTLPVVLLLALAACAEPGSSGGAPGGDAPSDGADTRTSETAGDSATQPAPDVPASLDGVDAIDGVDALDAAPDGAELPSAGPDNPSVGCLSDSQCADGELCCTLPLSYLSDCVIAADCHAGLHDACLVDAQCSARRPGEWTVCCHDRGNRNYCAPGVETCQPLVACTSPADCTGNGSDVCCSPHPYYEGSFCTNTFFAVPERDCP